MWTTTIPVRIESKTRTNFWICISALMATTCGCHPSWPQGRAGKLARYWRRQSRGDALHLVPQTLAAAGAKVDWERRSHMSSGWICFISGYIKIHQDIPKYIKIYQDTISRCTWDTKAILTSIFELRFLDLFDISARLRHLPERPLCNAPLEKRGDHRDGE